MPALRRQWRRGFAADVYWREPGGPPRRMSPGNGVYMMSCVHPSGSHAVCWGGAEGRPRLWYGDGDGTFEALTDGTFSARYPAFGLGGEHLVYCRSGHPSETVEQLTSGRTVLPDPHAPMDIVLRSLDGGWERQLTAGGTQDQRPALSPDGSEVVFVSNRRAPFELWKVGTESGAATPLLQGVRAYRPWWSVDGKHIYFFTAGPSRHQLHVMPASGGRPRPLVNDDRGDTHGPYADPDARSIIAHSTRNARVAGPGGWSLFEFPLDGSPARWLARGAHGTRARNGVLTFDARRW